MRILIAFLALTAAANGYNSRGQKIVGGEDAIIFQYPSTVALLFSPDLSTYIQQCGGAIINTRSILTAAHCIGEDATESWRVRVGSTLANNFGYVHRLASYVHHPDLIQVIFHNDITILRLANVIMYSDVVRPAFIAGPNYQLPDGDVAWAAGWGHKYFRGCPSERLQHVQVSIINHEECRKRYSTLNLPVTDTMLCSGWLDEGGRDQCQGDSGSPLYHQGNVVGITSWGYECAHPTFPGVNVRVSNFTTWIQANA